MYLIPGVLLIVRCLMLVFAWRQGLLRRFPLFYTYVLATLLTNLISVGVIYVADLAIEDAAYILLYAAGTIIIEGLACTVLIDAARRFDGRFRWQGYALALLVLCLLEYLFTPFRCPHCYYSWIMHVSWFFEAYCAYRATKAIFKASPDPGPNWKTITLGFLLSSSLLSVNYGLICAIPESYPYAVADAISRGATILMWLIFLFGMSRYRPPRVVPTTASIEPCV